MKKSASKLDPATEKAMQSAFNVRSTFLVMSRSSTAEQLSHTALELRRAETTISASPIEAHLGAASVELFPENHDNAEQSVRY
jgi:hypothetical protein